MPKRHPGRSLIRRRPGSLRWCECFTVAGVRHRASLGTEDEALACDMALERHRKAVERHQGVGRSPTPAKGQMTLQQALERWWSEVGSHQPSGAGRKRMLEAVAIPALGGGRTALSAIDQDALLSLVSHLRNERGAKPGTVNRYLSLLRVLLERAGKLWGAAVPEAESAIDWGALYQQDRHRLERFLSYREASALVDAAVPHARLPILLALWTGLRKANVTGLRWEEVSLDMRRIVLIQKGGRRHVAHLIPDAVSALAALQPDPALRRGPVFTYGDPAVCCTCSACVDPRRKGKQIGRLQDAFDGARKRAGMPSVRFHDCRHTVASWLLGRGYTLAHVKDALGHASIGTTMRYSHLEKSAVPEAMGHALSLPAHEQRKETA